MDVSPKGKMTTKELLRSLRDLALAVLAMLVSEVLRLLEMTDFGEYQVFVSALLAAVTILINRWLNIVRVDGSKIKFLK